jgi:hypothetical protein
VRRSFTTLAGCVAACALGAGMAALAIPSGGVPTASPPVVGTTAVSSTSGLGPNLAAPGPHPQLAGGVNTTLISSFNWSGYGALGSTSQFFRRVVGSWTVTPVICTSEDQRVSVWVGLDGLTNGTVEQLGTTAQCFEGVPTYYSWYEMYPSGSVEVGTTVAPGDKITASVIRTGTSYNLVLTDATTTGNDINVTQSCPLTTCADLSAEWIVERPSYGSTGILPLAKYKPIQFTGMTASGGTTYNGPVTAFPTNYQLQMIDSTGTYPLTTTGELNSTGKGFLDGWADSY